MEDAMKCNTCMAMFTSTEKIKDHYRSDWHVFNSRRRANELPPLRKNDFKLLNTETALLPKRVSSTSASASVASAKEVIPPKSAAETVKSASAAPAGDIVDAVGEGTREEEGGGQAPMQAEAVKERVLPPPLPIAPNVSLFDNKEFATTDECVKYMLRKFGFFIPDIEYLQDLDGLLTYLGEKIKLGGYCLYCQKQFIPGYPCQQHMIDSSHCKLAYDEEIDGEELEDFYDFSADYEDIDDDELLDEDGNEVDTGMQITELGELQLPSGKTVGHREFRRFYKQRYTSQDLRPCVLAQQREELLRLGGALEGHSEAYTAVVRGLSDAQVMSMLIKYNRQARRNAMIEQRAQQRANKAAQRREFVSTKDKLRSSENHTNKIRDYHSILM